MKGKINIQYRDLTNPKLILWKDSSIIDKSLVISRQYQDCNRRYCQRYYYKDRDHNHYEQFYGNKFEHLGEIIKFLETHVKKWTQVENLNMLFRVKYVRFIIISLHTYTQRIHSTFRWFHQQILSNSYGSTYTNPTQNLLEGFPGLPRWRREWNSEVQGLILGHTRTTFF